MGTTLTSSPHCSVSLAYSNSTPSQSILATDERVSSHLGYAKSSTGTLGIIQRIEDLDRESTQQSSGQPPSGDMATAQYMALIRQLPPKRYTKTLVHFFFAELAWRYDIVDEEMFLNDLYTWEQVSYAARSRPFNLAPDVRYFPALLFQILAQSLLFQPAQHSNNLDDLKHTPDMDLADLAAEFSDAGCQVGAIFGIRDVTFVKVQAGLLRACFQKTTGLVVEAWHTLGGAIRDAQELGLHRLKASDEFKSVAGSEQARQIRTGSKMWLILHLWDGHMAVVLGRPMATELNPDTVPFPGLEANCRDTLCHVELTTPFDVILCGYHAAYKYFRDIQNLDKAADNAYEKVIALHSAISLNISCIPAWARSPRAHCDKGHPRLSSACEILATEIYFTILALHRPFMFSHPWSRLEALKAAIRILDSQRRLFSSMEPQHYPAFDLVFATFDAVVIVSAAYIFFPGESLEHLQASLRGVGWALERLHAMKGRNKLAGSAYDVVAALHGKLLDRVTAAYGEPALYTTEQDMVMPTSMMEVEPSCTIPQELENILPPQPLHDLVFQDYTSDSLMAELSGEATGSCITQPVTDEAFWRVINSMGS